MHVCGYACAHVCMHICVCMHACMYAGRNICMYGMYACCMHVCMYVSMSACMYACVHALEAALIFANATGADACRFVVVQVCLLASCIVMDRQDEGQGAMKRRRLDEGQKGFPCSCGAVNFPGSDTWDAWVKLSDTKQDWMGLNCIGIFVDYDKAWEGQHSYCYKRCKTCMILLLADIEVSAEFYRECTNDDAAVFKRVILHGLREQIRDKLDRL